MKEDEIFENIEKKIILLIQNDDCSKFSNK